MKRSQGGVWVLPDRSGRPKPFGVQWREVVWDPALNDNQGGERRKTLTEFFDSAEKRDGRAAALRKQKKRGDLKTATRIEIEDFRAFRAAVQGTPWQDVVAGWRSFLMQNGIQECITTVDDAVKSRLASTLALSQTVPPKISPDTYRQIKHKLGLFAEQFGHLKLGQLSAQDIEDWIEDFDGVKSEVTFNDYRKHVRALLQPYVKRGELRLNPAAEIVKRDDSAGEIGILTVEEAARLFSFAQASEKYRVALGRLGLEAFAGLRFSSGCRLEKKEINFEDRGILLPKLKIKTRKRHYIDGLPNQVWAWLKITPEACWDLTARQYIELKSNLFIEAGVPHPHNCLRHSFCTYDIAAHKNPGRTATILCHRNQLLLWDRYKGNASEANGRRYQTITPATARRLAKDYVPLTASALRVETPQTIQAPSD
jgi:integrase